MDAVFKLPRPLSLDQVGVDGINSSKAKDVVVLARNFHLSRPQWDLLGKGLSFIPSLNSGRNHKVQLQLDMQHYHRKIKLAAYYRNSNKKVYLPFTGTSDWTPPLAKLPPAVGELIQEDVKMFRKHCKSVQESLNISSQEIRALQELKSNRNIVIKPADKGSAVVVLGRKQYVFEAERQLNNAQYYEKLEKPIYPQTIPMVASILEVLQKKKFINSKQKKYLLGDLEPRERRFYILPKIHKDPGNWTVPHEIPPGRPIVSDCGSETYFTAEYLDFYLNPLSTKHPAFIRDTYHFIQVVKSLTIPVNSYFFSMDVESLYTNIPIEAGISCVRRMFEKYPDPKRPDEELLQLLAINLRRNDFEFNGQYYLQIKGTAMGKRFAPAYANIFMANWEQEVFLKCKIKPAHYLRYLDDIWGIWTGSELEFYGFMEVLNSHDPSIKLKTELNSHSIDFLDTTVFKGPGFMENQTLDIKVHFKDTDTHALLHKTSFHPNHTFRGIIKSQIIRFKRICTREEHFMEAVHTLFEALRKRGYSRSFLRHCLKTFQEKKDKVRGELIPLITTYSSVSRYLNGKFKGNFDRIIGHTGIIQSSEVISAYRRNRNLKDLLVRAKISSPNWEKPQVIDTQFTRLRFIQNFHDKSVYRIQQGFTPKSQNCIYVLYCEKCGIQYIGETKNTLSTRMTQHRYNIKNKKEVDTPLVKHFLHHGYASIRMAGLQRNINWTDWERKKKEKYWIYLLGTREPQGLNIK